MKAAAFLPNPQDRTTSVFRHNGFIGLAFWQVGIEVVVADRPLTLHGAAFITAAEVRSAGLEALADEPPVNHAILCNWPVNTFDTGLEKASHLEIANIIASKSTITKRF